MNTRRTFLRGAGLSAGAPLLSGATPTPATPAAARVPPPPMLKPRALQPGDTVGLVSPSSYIFDLWSVETAVARLEAPGRQGEHGATARARHGYMAGTVRERVEDLHAMFADPSVAAVFCLGGGYGTERLLDALDY